MIEETPNYTIFCDSCGTKISESKLRPSNNDFFLEKKFEIALHTFEVQIEVKKTKFNDDDFNADNPNEQRVITHTCEKCKKEIASLLLHKLGRHYGL